MLPTVCECGLRCRIWKGDVAVCPRCRKIFITSEHGLTIVEGQPADAMICEFEGWMCEALAIFLPKPEDREPAELPQPSEKYPPPRHVALCDMCGASIEDKCGAVCEGCGWIKPCSLE